MSRKQIIGFVLGLLLVSWIAQGLVLAAFGSIEAPGAAPFAIGIMFLPGLFGLAFTFRSEAVRRSVKWKPGGVAAIVTAMLLPLLLALVAIGLLSAGGWGASDYFELQGSSMSLTSGPWLFGTGPQSWLVLAANLIVTTMLYSTITGLATIGEEYGWRGVLQDALIRELGFTRGVALLGAIWGIWHFPIILSGYNYPETPVLGAFLFMPGLLIGASFVMAWLTRWNRSFWPAVFMHGTINSVYDALMSNVTLTSPSDYTMTVLEIGLFAVLAAVAWKLTILTTSTTASAAWRAERWGPMK